MPVISYSRKHTTSLVTSHFRSKPFVALVAPMQSGKTTTYLEIAKQALESGLVQKVVVFSGNRETMLRDQTNDRAHHFATVVWGPELKHYIPNHFIPTLYIWDESHYGQSDDQEVDRFCARCGICPAGMDSIPGVYCLSVSATPFSEVIDAENTNKLVIFQKTSKYYYGIANMLENGLIRTFTDYKDQMRKLVEALSKTKSKVGLVRLREDKGENKLEMLQSICQEYKVELRLYDASSDDDDLTRAIETKPSKSHVVVVKGKLKMGKTINDKRHVMFCMETAKSSNADTLLQGFMGRFCGYKDPAKGLYLNKETCFYIHANNIDGPTDYVAYFHTLGVTSPKTGMNLVYSSRDKLEYAKVEKVNVDMIDPAVISIAVQRKTDWVNDENVISILKSIPSKGYKIREWAGDKPIEAGIVPTIYAGHGGLSVGKSLNFYQGVGCVYLVFSINQIVSQVTTTKKEIFAKRLKMIYQNGFVIGGPRIQSFVEESDMMSDIHKLISASKIAEGLIERKIQNKDGVRISLRVYESLNKGNIYKQMKKKEHVRIKVGRIISKDAAFVVVEDISW